jgi:hypothetical protein
MVEDMRERAVGMSCGNTVAWYMIVSRDEEQRMLLPRESIMLDIVDEV